MAGGLVTAMRAPDGGDYRPFSANNIRYLNANSVNTRRRAREGLHTQHAGPLMCALAGGLIPVWTQESRQNIDYNVYCNV